MSIQSTTPVRRARARLAAPASMVWLCLGIVYVVWGSTYLAIRVAVETMPPLLMGAARFVTAGLLLYAVARARGAPSVRTLSRRQLVACWVVGSLLAAGGITMLVAGLAVGEASDVHPSRFSTDSILAFAYLIFIGSLVAYTAYVWLLQNAPISKVATYAYVNPVIAIFLGWAILSENI